MEDLVPSAARQERPVVVPVNVPDTVRVTRQSCQQLQGFHMCVNRKERKKGRKTGLFLENHDLVNPSMWVGGEKGRRCTKRGHRCRAGGIHYFFSGGTRAAILNGTMVYLAQTPSRTYGSCLIHFSTSSLLRIPSQSESRESRFEPGEFQGGGPTYVEGKKTVKETSE